jgi:hypothetical protein
MLAGSPAWFSVRRWHGIEQRGCYEFSSHAARAAATQGFSKKGSKDFQEDLESLQSLRTRGRARKVFTTWGEHAGCCSPSFAAADKRSAAVKEVSIMEYKYEVTSEIGFLQRVATHLLPKGYFFFVQGTLPEGKNPAALDAKLLAKYDVAKSKGRVVGERVRAWGTCSTFAIRSTGFCWRLMAITPFEKGKETT